MSNPLNEIPQGQRQPPRYSSRLVVLEEPQIVERLAKLGRQRGHSLAAEVRTALRAHLEEASR